MRKTYIACMSNAPQFAYSHIALVCEPFDFCQRLLVDKSLLLVLGIVYPAVCGQEGGENRCHAKVDF